MPQSQTHFTTEQIQAKCFAIIDGHAHRNILKDGDIRAWVGEVVRMHGEMAVWHAVRAGGFGGSEIGVLVRNHEGNRADHQNSAHDIIEGKLLRRTPDQETGHLRRGHDNEPRHAEWFYAKYGAHRDEQAFKMLSNSVGMRPWMRYSPDEVCLVPIAEPNPALGGAKFARWLADYKAPSVVEEDAEIAFQYACQLHQGALVCAKAGIHLDGLVLSQFSWAGWELKDDQVPYDAELSRRILRAGDHYWDYVMRGEVPAYIRRPRFENEEEIRAQWEAQGTQIAQLLAMGKAVEEQLTAKREVLAAFLAQYRMAGTKLKVGELTVNTVAKVDHEKVNEALPEKDHEAIAQSLAKKGSVDYDAKKMASHLRSLGVSLKPFAKVKFDEALAYEYLSSQGLDADAFIKEELRMSPSEGLLELARETVRAAFLQSEDVPQELSRPAADAHSVAPDEAAGEQNDRAGRDTERSAPRSVSA